MDTLLYLAHRLHNSAGWRNHTHAHIHIPKRAHTHDGVGPTVFSRIIVNEVGANSRTGAEDLQDRATCCDGLITPCLSPFFGHRAPQAAA